jgi:hypothetical protein
VSIENSTPRAEQVTAGMEYFSKGAWRAVLTDAEIVVKPGGRRARFQIRGAGGNPVLISMAAHATVRARRPADTPSPDCADPTA